MREEVREGEKEGGIVLIGHTQFLNVSIPIPANTQ